MKKHSKIQEKLDLKEITKEESQRLFKAKELGAEIFFGDEEEVLNIDEEKNLEEMTMRELFLLSTNSEKSKIFFEKNYEKWDLNQLAMFSSTNECGIPILIQKTMLESPKTIARTLILLLTSLIPAEDLVPLYKKAISNSEGKEIVKKYSKGCEPRLKEIIQKSNINFEGETQLGIML